MTVSMLLARTCVLLASLSACAQPGYRRRLIVSESDFHTRQPRLPAHIDCLDPLISPWPAQLTSGWRDARHPIVPHFHAGIDLEAPVGTPILAPADGTVVEVILVRNPTSDVASTSEVVVTFGVFWFYSVAHLSRIDVRPGQRIRRGHVLGLSGGKPGAPGSGPLTTGPHVHFQVTYDEKFADPRPYFCEMP